MAEAQLAERIDSKRLWQRLTELARFGATIDGGVNRQALSDEEIAARAELIRWGRSVGLKPHTDELANLFLRLPGSDPSLPPILIGSHIDSQPTGGRFDGVYGVLAALEVAECLRESSRVPQRSVEVVAWMNEEGSRFAPGMMGSAGYAGARKVSDILAARDADGVSVEAAIARMLAADTDVPQRDLGRAAFAYIEPHIEQGPILEREGVEIGIVTGIQGKRTFRVVVEGEENHAGTSPRSARRDALVAAVAIVDALQKAIWDEADVVRFTIGRFVVAPNAPSVVPSRVEFSIDLRHPDAKTLCEIGDRIAVIAEAHAGACRVRTTELLHDAPLEFPERIRGVLRQAANDAGLRSRDIASGAGHDARYLSGICSAGMIFIPCRGGISHHPSESIEPDHAAAGARVLAGAVQALLRYARQESYVQNFRR